MDSGKDKRLGQRFEQGSIPGRNKRKYTQEYRESAVKLVTHEHRTPAQAAANLGMPVNTLIAWVHQSRTGKGNFTSRDDQDLAVKVRELESEVKRLRLERDILTKATAFFARQEAGDRP